ncbi:MAG: hypothetical protein EBS93_07045 [Chitinophagia bacterium]|nr:hypothetical protein [Chitinophagia bacterium]NCA30455.1 hypothetical protein [Chitinophagia bacterium]
MNKNSDPLDYLIQCCETAINTGQWKLTKFTVLNAKDELNKLRTKIKDFTKEAFDANQFAVQEINRNLEFTIVAWARKNDRGDLYDLRMIQNPYLDPSIVVPLYSDGKTLHDNSAQ